MSKVKLRRSRRIYVMEVRTTRGWRVRNGQYWSSRALAESGMANDIDMSGLRPEDCRIVPYVPEDT